jgi:nicotinate-nucleotide adenylyltransferase
VNAVGLFGGTFDPIHYGHLKPVDQVRRSLALASVRIVPCATPPHRRPPAASTRDRLAMVKLALTEYPDLRLDTRELDRGGVSYTVDTLESLRAEAGDRPLCLIVGMDAFLGLESWHRWAEIPELAHILVMQRPGWNLDIHGAALPGWAATRLVTDPLRLDKQPAGWVAVVPVTPVDVSATEIRRLVAAGGDPDGMLPGPVWQYIQAHGLYGYRAYA